MPNCCPCAVGATIKRRKYGFVVPSYKRASDSNILTLQFCFAHGMPSALRLQVMRFLASGGFFAKYFLMPFNTASAIWS